MTNGVDSMMTVCMYSVICDQQHLCMHCRSCSWSYCGARDHSSSVSSHGNGDGAPSCTISAFSLGMLISNPPFLIFLVVIIPLIPLVCPACSLGMYRPLFDAHFRSASTRSSAAGFSVAGAVVSRQKGCRRSLSCLTPSLLTQLAQPDLSLLCKA